MKIKKGSGKQRQRHGTLHFPFPSLSGLKGVAGGFSVP